MTDSTLEIASSMGEVQNKVTLLSDQARTLSNVASRAISFTRKNWVDNQSSGTPITAADLNRIEQAIVDLNNSIDDLRDSVSCKGISVTPNTAILNYQTYTNSSWRMNDVVMIQFSMIFSRPTTLSSSTLTLFNLPSGIAPVNEKQLSRQAIVVGGDTGENVMCRGIIVRTNGVVAFENLASTGTPQAQVICIPGVAFRLNA